MTNPRVFLTVALEHTYLSNLSDYGTCTYLYKSIPNIWSRTLEDEVIARARSQKFDPTLDFYAASGIIPLSHLTLVTLVGEYGPVKTLLWDNQTHSYRMKVIG